MKKPDTRGKYLEVTSVTTKVRDCEPDYSQVESSALPENQ